MHGLSKSVSFSYRQYFLSLPLTMPTIILHRLPNGVESVSIFSSILMFMASSMTDFLDLDDIILLPYTSTKRISLFFLSFLTKSNAVSTVAL